MELFIFKFGFFSKKEKKKLAPLCLECLEKKKKKLNTYEEF